MEDEKRTIEGIESLEMTTELPLAEDNEDLKLEVAETASTNQEKAEETTKKELEQLKRFTEEDEDFNSATKTLRGILGGDFLTGQLVRRQVPLVILIFFCFFLHISFRYMNQKELIEIDKLKIQLDDARYNALTRFSELTAKSRQSYVEEFLRQHQDSTLQTATQPPFIIHLRGDNESFPQTEMIENAPSAPPIEQNQGNETVSTEE